MRISHRKIADLRFAEYNPRRLTDEQAASLRESLTRFEVWTPPSAPSIVAGGQINRSLERFTRTVHHINFL